ncbi:MAG: antibiotic biosynthesis monooxygenase [Enterobacterales bacterium]|nr:antibiotic biosynthesis monooxygenase [Enterobacterales bacterium]
MTNLSQNSNSKPAHAADLSQANYLVSFISVMSGETSGYRQAAIQMLEAVHKQSGFIAAYSARETDGIGITNSYWRDIEAIEAWKNDTAHRAIQNKGKTQWYQWFQLQVCEIIRQNDG